MERIDELTGLPTTRTGVVPRESGALGPGAEGGRVCASIPYGGLPRACACGGTWGVWNDYGRRLLVYRHLAPGGKVYTRSFDEYRHPTTGDMSGVIDHLTAHEVHPVNAPTPGKARR